MLQVKTGTNLRKDELLTEIKHIKVKGLTAREESRYSKHIMIPEIGVEGQLKLRSSSVLVVGAGGLGCPVLQYLTASGIGTLGIVEYDVVDESNLQRQILYGSMDKGKLKSIISRDRLNLQNDLVDIKIFNIKAIAENAIDLFTDFDIIVDATDNYAARYVIDDACVKLEKPMVHGAIYKFEGQVSVFNYKGGPTYRSYNPEVVADNSPPPSEVGLFGVLPGITGTYMAMEVMKIITGLPNILTGKMLIFNILNNTSYTITINKNP